LWYSAGMNNEPFKYNPLETDECVFPIRTENEVVEDNQKKQKPLHRSRLMTGFETLIEGKSLKYLTANLAIVFLGLVMFGTIIAAFNFSAIIILFGGFIVGLAFGVNLVGWMLKADKVLDESRKEND